MDKRRSLQSGGEYRNRWRGSSLYNLTSSVTSVQLHHLFHALGPGTIEDVWVQRDKGFGFIRYSTHDEAALAIHIGNARVLCGKPIKWSWGSKPTPLPPPAAAHMPVFSAYEGQMAEQDGWCSCSYESTWSACAEAGSHGNGCPCG